MTPKLAVVLPTDSWARIERTVACLAGQGDPGALELLLVVPAGSNVRPPEELSARFGAVRVAAVAALHPLAAARVAGVRASTAPYVAFGETHAFAAPGWAEALVSRLDGGYDGAGPAVTNANPATALSWAGLLLDYGQWLAPRPFSEVDDLPGHNSAYRREHLDRVADTELAELFEAETNLHLSLRRAGGRLVLDPAAVLSHTNVDTWRLALRERFAVSRRFAAGRARPFSRRRRTVYVLGTPLVPALRLLRLRSDLHRVAEVVPLRRLLPVLLLCLAVSAAGELAGTAFGPGGSERFLSELELTKLDRLRHDGV